MEVHYISSQYQVRYVLFGVLGHPLSYISSASLNREFMQLSSHFFLYRPLVLINQTLTKRKRMAVCSSVGMVLILL